MTPFEGGKLDEEALDNLIKAQIAAGVDGIGVDLFGWGGSGPQGLATPAALRADPASFLASGAYMGLLAMPSALSAAFTDFFPRTTDSRASPQLGLSDPELAAVVANAWVQPASAAETMH